MRKPILILLAMLIHLGFSKCQGGEDTLAFRKNVIYAEFLGAGILLPTINYERTLLESKKLGLSARIGVKPITFYEMEVDFWDLQLINKDRWMWLFPAGLSVTYKRKKPDANLFFEQGMYVSWILKDVVKYAGRTFLQSRLYGHINLAGFRIQPKNQKSGFFFRTDASIVVSVFEVFYNDFFWGVNAGPLAFPMLGISFGYAF